MLKKGIGPMNLGGTKVCGKCQGSVCNCDGAPTKWVQAAMALAPIAMDMMKKKNENKGDKGGGNPNSNTYIVNQK